MAEQTETKKKAPAKAPQDCTCGCGEQTGGGNYRPGHDSRHVSQVAAEDVKVSGQQREQIIKRLPTEALQAKARNKVTLEDERAAAKAAKAKAKEAAA